LKRALITQRHDPVEGRDETRDALDIRFADLLWQMGFLPIPVCSTVSDPQRYVAALAPDVIILTGGNDIGTAPDRDNTEAALLDLATQDRLPVFAVCRGLQMVNHTQGGTTVALPGHVATRHIVRGPLVPQGREVNSYHGQCVMPQGLGRDLEALAYAPDGSVEALRHIYLPWLAVMWHPERESTPDPQDMALIKRHLDQTTGETL
jgi:anthranilate/para-aminobenzoate synthase component II